MLPLVKEALPDADQILQALPIILRVNLGPNPEFLKECHHLSQRHTRHFRGLPERRLSLSIFLYDKQNPAACH
jgi:hypothetical protein